MRSSSTVHTKAWNFQWEWKSTFGEPPTPTWLTYTIVSTETGQVSTQDLGQDAVPARPKRIFYSQRTILPSNPRVNRWRSQRAWGVRVPDLFVLHITFIHWAVGVCWTKYRWFPLTLSHAKKWAISFGLLKWGSYEGWLQPKSQFNAPPKWELTLQIKLKSITNKD